MQIASAPATPLHPRARSFGQYLLDCGTITAMQLLQARGFGDEAARHLMDLLPVSDAEFASELYGRYADWLGIPLVSPASLTADPYLLHLIGPQRCAKNQVVPLSLRQGHLLLACARPDRLQAAQLNLTLIAPHLDLLLAEPAHIEAAIAEAGRAPLTEMASARVACQESCRDWRAGRNLRICLGGLGILLALVIWFPSQSFVALLGWACLCLAVATLTKTLSILAYLRLRRQSKPALEPPSHAPPPHRPIISVLVPLYREAEIASHLVKRLSRLTYPKALLEVVLVLEETDTVSHRALDSVSLPHWTRVITVPDGHPRTKPRAMNYALDFCRGEIIGIYDAEDAPEPDQLEVVAQRFAAAAPDLACLQGILDYYNPRQNWLARCFTIEYATWFRVMLPGMRHLGFAIPLGGTTLFFRRHALEELGGWDAHNVTEDADLGFRLARHGYRTEMVATTTREEANCHLIPWIKQRSRWHKGYMVTYLVHMRDPALLVRQLGLRQFLGFQLHFITTLSLCLLAPLLWSLWLLLFDLPHPLMTHVGAGALQSALPLFLLVELITIGAGMIAVSGRDHRHLLAWVPSLHLYFPLGFFAVYKALFELIVLPFYWDKTKHGLSLIKPASAKAAKRV